MIQSIDRAINILEYIKLKRYPCSIKELAEETHLPQSTVYRILQTLSLRGYINYNSETHMYSLGSDLISLGFSAADQYSLKKVARPVLRALSKDVNEDTYLIVRMGYMGVILDKYICSQDVLHIIETHGYIRELHCGAIRKTLLAFQPDAFIEDFLSMGLKKYTNLTVTDPDVLREQVYKIRADHAAMSNGEYVKGGVGIGAPVFDSHSIIASIGIILPGSRSLSKRDLEHMTNRVQEAAIYLSATSGCNDYFNA